MWRGNLATAVCWCRCVQLRLEEEEEGSLLKEPGVGCKMQQLHYSTLMSKLPKITKLQDVIQPQEADIETQSWC